MHEISTMEEVYIVVSVASPLMDLVNHESYGDICDRASGLNQRVGWIDMSNLKSFEH